MKRKLICVLIALICIIAIIPSFTLAGDINTDDFSDIYKKEGTSKVIDAGGQILGVVQIIGVSCGVICLIILGIKYMYSSTEDKATIKERLIPYLIGAIIMFGGTGLLTIIANFAQSL